MFPNLTASIIEDAWEKGNKSLNESVRILLNIKPSVSNDVEKVQEEYASCLTYEPDEDDEDLLRPAFSSQDHSPQDQTSIADEGSLREVITRGVNRLIRFPQLS